MRANQILGGLGWSVLSFGVNAAAQLVIAAILARQLAPAVFGAIAMATIATRFASYFGQMGAMQTLIQSPTIDARLVTATLAVSVSASTFLYALLVLAAPAFAWYFKSPDLVSILIVLGLTLPIGALATPPLAMLRRAGRFRGTSLIEVAGFVLGYGATGIACALSGLGVWSIVFATLAQQVLVTVCSYAMAKVPLQWSLEKASIKRVWGVGSRYSLIGFLEFMWGTIETLFIGRMLGQTTLGLFNRAQMLTNLPVELAVGAVTKVLFPALSAMQGDRPRLADGFVVMLLCAGGLSVAVAGTFVAAAGDIVHLVLGPRWAEAVPLVQILALAVPSAFSYVSCGVALDSIGAAGPKLRFQTWAFALKVPIVLVAGMAGPAAIAGAIAICELARLLMGARLVTQLLDVKAAAVVRVFSAHMVLGIAVTAFVLGARLTCEAAGFGLLPRVLIELTAGVCASGFVLSAIVLSGLRVAPIERFELLGRLHHAFGQAMRSIIRS